MVPGRKKNNETSGSLVSSPDVSMVTVFVRLVSDDLDPAVRQGHAVLPGGLVAVARLLVGEVVAGVAVLHGITERVVGRLLEGNSG